MTLAITKYFDILSKYVPHSYDDITFFKLTTKC